jgi:hypothetical protein
VASDRTQARTTCRSCAADAADRRSLRADIRAPQAGQLDALPRPLRFFLFILLTATGIFLHVLALPFIIVIFMAIHFG